MLVSFFKLWFYDLPACKLEDWNVTISHRPHSSLMRKGVQKGMGVKTILPIDSTCIIRNNVVLPKTNKLFLFSY